MTCQAYTRNCDWSNSPEPLLHKPAIRRETNDAMSGKVIGSRLLAAYFGSRPHSSPRLKMVHGSPLIGFTDR